MMRQRKTRQKTKRRLSVEKPTVQIGKSGVTPHIIAEIDRQLKEKKPVKVKILQTALGELKTQEIAKIISQETESALLDVRGHSFILRRRKTSDSL